MKKVTLPELDAMSMKPSHTPTLVPALMPWKVRVVKYGEAYTSVLETADGKYIGEICGVENSQTIQAITLAQLIVKCVNAHQPLIRALLEAQASLIGVSFHSQKKVNEIIEQALAQAEGK